MYDAATSASWTFTEASQHNGTSEQPSWTSVDLGCDDTLQVAFHSVACLAD